MSKTFYAKTSNMDADSIDDLILDAAEIHGTDINREEITDELRQAYVDISFDADFILDAITFGEDYYARNVNKRIVAKILQVLGK